MHIKAQFVVPASTKIGFCANVYILYAIATQLEPAKRQIRSCVWEEFFQQILTNNREKFKSFEESIHNSL